MTKIFTSSQKPLRTSGKDSLKTLHEKKVSRTTGQPGLVRIQAARPPMTTMLEAAAIAWPRRVPAAFRSLPREAAVADDGSPGQPAPL